MKLLSHERRVLVPTAYGGAAEADHAYRVLLPNGQEVLAPELPARRTKSSLVFDLGRNAQGRRSYVTEVQNARCYQENGVSGPFLLADCSPAAFAGQFVLQTIPGKLAFAYRSRVGGPWLYAELLGIPETFDPNVYEDYQDRRLYRNVWPGVNVWLRLWPDRAFRHGIPLGHRFYHPDRYGLPLGCEDWTQPRLGREGRSRRACLDTQGRT